MELVMEHILYALRRLQERKALENLCRAFQLRNEAVMSFSDESERLDAEWREALAVVERIALEIRSD